MPPHHRPAPQPGKRTPEEIALTTALNDLYTARGRPSRRDMSREIQGSFGASTIGDALNGLGLPGWDTFAAVVAYLDGDTAHFLDLYQRARVARSASRHSAATASTILLCVNHPPEGATPTAVYVYRGDSLCGPCKAAAG